jgi:hypothetical protein
MRQTLVDFFFVPFGSPPRGQEGSDMWIGATCAERIAKRCPYFLCERFALSLLRLGPSPCAVGMIATSPAVLLSLVIGPSPSVLVSWGSMLLGHFVRYATAELSATALGLQHLNSMALLFFSGNSEFGRLTPHQRWQKKD